MQKTKMKGFLTILVLSFIGIGFAGTIDNNVYNTPIGLLLESFTDILGGFAHSWQIGEVSGQSPSAQSTGSFTLNAAPSVSAVDFQDDTYVSDSALDPDDTTWQRLNFTVSTSAGISDILNVTIWIYDDSVHGADYNTTTVDGIQIVEFLWVEATDTWSVSDQGSMTQWNVDSINSDDPGSASSDTSFKFSMRYQISKVARADTDWNATVHVYDDDTTPEWAYASESALVTMNNYFELSFSTATFSWGSSVQPNSDNNTHGAVTLTIYANAQWEITLSASNFTATAETDVTPETNDIIVWDEDGTGGGTSKWVRNTTAIMLGTWDNQAPMTTESGFTRNFYLFLNPGSLFTVGKQWSVIITATCQANT